ncbi:hypothetical protein PUNSTDRAFT_71840, partial [Punctularia strigosozonata HHB-11173 SS5]|uniref:uncharacterized protein n=1 Tax=Punctularia strigosozonata (strain HHB-11173) TaxID=741275 RepID=UPI00044170EC
WIRKQELFWVATAPLSPHGHVNVSPKGLKSCFHVESPNEVWYEDMAGSGGETAAHVRENGRITIMFSAFEGAAMILRLFGTTVVHEFGTSEYNRRIDLSSRTPGSRAVVEIRVHKAGTSCGYAVPIYTFQKHRTALLNFAYKRENKDLAFDGGGVEAICVDGLKAYWNDNNIASMDGLPAFDECYKSAQPVTHAPIEEPKRKLDTKEAFANLDAEADNQLSKARPAIERDVSLITLGFMVGLCTTAIASCFASKLHFV